MRVSISRFLKINLAAVAVLLAAVPAAEAAPDISVQLVEGELTYRVVSPVPDRDVSAELYDEQSIIIYDVSRNDDIPAAPAGCQVSSRTIKCPISSVKKLRFVGTNESEKFSAAFQGSNINVEMDAQGGNDRLAARLDAGLQSRFYGGSGDDFVMIQGGFPSIHGGEGNDELMGTGAERQDVGLGVTHGFYGQAHIYGDAGNDTFTDVSLDHDTVSGGEGADTLDLSFYRNDDYEPVVGTRVTLDGLANDGAYWDFKGNMMGDIESVTGTRGPDKIDASGSSTPVTLDGDSGNDTLIGSRWDDAILGGDDDDFMRGGPGKDRFIGEDGFIDGMDTVSYEGLPGPVNITVGNKANDGPANEGDDISLSVDRVIGTDAGDTFRGIGEHESYFFGRKGDDKFYLSPKAERGSYASCGSGNDRVLGYVKALAAREIPGDLTSSDCEVARVAGVLKRFGVQGEKSPWLQVSARKITRSGSRVYVPVTCKRGTNGYCKAKLTLFYKGRSVGSVSKQVSVGKSAVISVPVTRQSSTYKAVLTVADKAKKKKRSSAYISAKSS